MLTVSSVGIELKVKFEREVKSYVTQLNGFIDGKNKMPEGNTQQIVEKYTELGYNELKEKSKINRARLKKVSRETFEDLLEAVMKSINK